MKQHPLRVVAIDPTTRGFAYAVLEGPENLIDWGLVHVLVRTDANVLSRVEQIIDRCIPGLLVVEDGRGTRRRERGKRLIGGIERIARQRELPIVRVSRSRVRGLLAPAETKQEIAEALAARFPELAPRLPRPRKPWMTEDERMSIFDALSFAITAAGTESF
jgi:hypothetical protein